MTSGTECLKFIKYATASGWILVQKLDSASSLGIIPLAFVKKIKQPADIVFSADLPPIRPSHKKPDLSKAYKVSTLPRNIKPQLALSNALKNNPSEITDCDLGISDPDSDINLIYTQNAHGENEMRAASLDKLVEKLTCCRGVPARLPHDVLLTYTTFTNSFTLLEKLERRFFPSSSLIKGLKADEHDIYEKKILSAVRLRVLNTMKIWIEDHWRSYFASDLSFVNQVSNFLKKLKSVQKYENMTIRMMRTIDDRSTNVAPMIQKPPPPPPKIPDTKVLEFLPPHIQWKAFHPEEVARQLSLSDYDLMNAIDPTDLIQHIRTKQKDRDPESTVLKSIDRFNRNSLWVPSTICLLEKRSLRVEAIQFFIDVCEQLYKMNNFTSLTGLVAGLSSGNVRRLKSSWERVPAARKKLLAEYQELLTPEGNYLNLRTHLHGGIQKPALPYLGQFLSDLTFINDGNPATLASPADQTIRLINVGKCRLISSVLTEFKTYFAENQALRYNFKEVPSILSYLENVSVIDEETCYKLSCHVEPKEGKTRNSVKPKDKKSLSPAILEIIGDTNAINTARKPALTINTPSTSLSSLDSSTSFRSDNNQNLNN